MLYCTNVIFFCFVKRTKEYCDIFVNLKLRRPVGPFFVSAIDIEVIIQDKYT